MPSPYIFDAGRACMDLRQLRYFVALIEYRSFVRAADAMGITQPAFSRSIQGLEQALGCQLVDRGNKDLRPTPEGQVVLQHALRLVQGASNLVNEINQMTKLDAGELHFGCGPAPAASLVPDALAAFIRRHPRVNARFEVNNWETLGRLLAREEIEFFIADIRQFETDPNFQTRELSPRRGVSSAGRGIRCWPRTASPPTTCSTTRWPPRGCRRGCASCWPASAARPISASTWNANTCPRWFRW